jgi:hypothetical protein
LSLVFIVIDILGGVFSILALAYGSVAIDWTTASFYLIVSSCDVIILVLWLILPRLFPNYVEDVNLEIAEKEEDEVDDTDSV